MQQVKKNSQAVMGFLLFSKADASEVTGAGSTPVVQVLKPGTNAFAATGGVVLEVSEGLYRFTPAAEDTDVLGMNFFRAKLDGARNYDWQVEVVAVDFADGNAFGLSRLDQTVGSRLAQGSYTAPPTAASIATAVWGASARTLTSLGADFTTLSQRVLDIWRDAFNRKRDVNGVITTFGDDGTTPLWTRNYSDNGTREVGAKEDA